MKIRLAAWLFSGACAWAASGDVHTVRASADATVQATPDRAEITIGITTTAADAGTAGSRNAALTQRVMDAVHGVVKEGGNLKTVGYSVQPQYQYTQGGTPKLTGYEATDSLQVSLDDLSLPGKVIDTALQAGATNVGGVSFTLRDQSTVMDEALAQAAETASKHAEAIAAALHLRVTGVVSAETGRSEFAPRPIAMAAMAKSQAASTPVDPGTLDVSATVTVVLSVE